MNIPRVDKADSVFLQEKVTCFPQSFTGLPGDVCTSPREALSSEADFGAPDGCLWPSAGAWAGRERKGDTGSLIKRLSLPTAFLLLRGGGGTRA